MTFALFNSNIVLQTQNELKYLWVFCIYKILLRKIYSYMDKICWSDRKTDKVQANIDI